MDSLLEQALRLPLVDRRKLADQIYESIGQEAGSAILTDEQKAEIDRRLEEYRENPSIAVPLKNFLSRFDSR